MRPSDQLNFNERREYRLEGDGTYVTKSISATWKVAGLARKRSQKNEQRKKLVFFLKVAVANSAKKQLKKVAALLSPLLSVKSSGATANATVKVAPLQ